MGKWAEVECVCVNRLPVPGGAYEERPHRSKYPLSQPERKVVEEWELTRKDIFECGHRDGMIYEVWPGDVILLGNLIAEFLINEQCSYEIFVKVGDWRSYKDEILEISPDDAARWLTEIQNLSEALHDLHGSRQEQIMRLVLTFLNYERDEITQLNQNLEEARDRLADTAFNSLSQNVQGLGVPDLATTIQKIVEALDVAARLCKASSQTRNPIRMLCDGALNKRLERTRQQQASPIYRWLLGPAAQAQLWPPRYAHSEIPGAPIPGSIFCGSSSTHAACQ